MELTAAASNDDENITDIQRDTIDGFIEDVHKTKQTKENDEEIQKKLKTRSRNNKRSNG